MKITLERTTWHAKNIILYYLQLCPSSPIYLYHSALSLSLSLSLCVYVFNKESVDDDYIDTSWAICLFDFLSVHMYVYVYVHVSVWIYVHMRMRVFTEMCTCICPPIFRFPPISIYLSPSISVYLLPFMFLISPCLELIVSYLLPLEMTMGATFSTSSMRSRTAR